MMRYVLRFDDIAPGMAWRKFLPLKSILEELEISCLLGVVPSCQDESLEVEGSRVDLFDRVRTWKQQGDTIAQHGTHHRYVTESGGLLGTSSKSEFAGLAADEQLRKLSIGKAILEKEGVWQPYFMAPAHSFDLFTLEALGRLGFLAVTDGFGLWPYKIRGITLVPQLTATPLRLGFGVSTICVHINSASDETLSRLSEFCKANRHKFVSFEQARVMPTAPRPIGAACRAATRLLLVAKRRNW